MPLLDQLPNRLECFHCNDEIGDWMYTVRFGEFDAEAQNYDRAPIHRHYCEDCYRDRYKRDKAAHTTMDAGRLWDVLEAADGELVADLYGFFVGSRPFVRVVDGELQGVKMVASKRPGKVLKFEPKRVDDVDEEWFRETVRRERRSLPDEIPVMLKPVDETPFDEFVTDGKDRCLEEFDGGDQR